jgi:hypothetical protein
MCATCGCGDPKNKHGKKTLKEANKAGAKKTPVTKDAKKKPAFLEKKMDKKKK